MKIAELKRSPDEMKREKELMGKDRKPEPYSPSTRIHLNGEHLEEMGHKDTEDNPDDEYEIHGRGKIHSSEKTKGADGKPERRMEFQITHMGMSKRGGGKKTVREDVEDAMKGNDTPKESKTETSQRKGNEGGA